MKRTLATITLCTLAISACKNHKTQDPNTQTNEAYETTNELTPQAQRLTDERDPNIPLFQLPQSVHEHTEYFQLLQPPSQDWRGIRAPEEESFLLAIPLDERTPSVGGALLLTAPQNALRETTSETFQALHHQRLTVLFLPPADQRAPDDESELQILDEIEDLQTATFPLIPNPKIPALVHAKRQAQQIFELCAPIETQNTRSERTIGQRCRHWAWHENQLLELDDSDERVTRWVPVDSANDEHTDPFIRAKDGQLWRELRVPIPWAKQTEIPVALEWSLHAGAPGPLDWRHTNAASELEDWSQNNTPGAEEDAQKSSVENHFLH